MNSFLETLKQLGPTRLSIMGGILLALVTFLIFISMRVSSPDFSLLYSDLSTGDAAAMASQLEQAQIPYQVSDDSSSILVPANDVGRSRMLLAEAGLPNGGSIGYELFDKQSGFGTTNDIVNLNKVRALEGELARTITSLEPVKTARVHLVLPQRELFSRENRPASGSVALGLQNGAALDADQIAAIQSLVAAAVPQLKASSVALIDQNGKLLARGDEEGVEQANLKAEEMRLNYEQRMTRSVEDLVGRIVGYGKVRASVTADLNFDRVSTNEEVFDPETQVVRSSQTVEENNVERNASEDNVSVERNLPAAGNDLFFDNAPSLESNRIEETTNFEISKVTRNMIRETGEVRRISVAVLVDGKYVQGPEGESTYEPRSEAELDQISALVRSAIGFDANRGDTLEVVNLQFAEIEVSDTPFDNTLFGFDKNKLLDAAEIITVAIMFILIILLVIQPMVGRLLTVEKDGADEDMDIETGLLTGSTKMALEGPSGEFEPTPLNEEEDDMINMKSVEGKVKASSVKKVEDIVENYPDEAVSVIRSWMTQD
ncbi:MAG: flagellar M-ring protein FliF [Alphaproteobacteria bacterium]|nr:flagellar M-ring protein FliF [Alphaproteobacteria bacterium]NCQ87573.1 flagellar M-ring protein FliF [Alphaproteobacteria bacterium]NCT06442.1 flagellar M-ring protein FliF [Alphaproteobacteria bacterium]